MALTTSFKKEKSCTSTPSSGLSWPVIGRTLLSFGSVFVLKCSKYRTAAGVGKIGHYLGSEAAVIVCIRMCSRFSNARWLLQAHMPSYAQQRIQLVVLYVHTQVCGRDVHNTALQRDGNFATVNVLMLDDVT